MVQRAILVLSQIPDRDAAEVIAQRVATDYADDDQRNIVWYLDDEVPEWVGISTADQLYAHKRDAGEQSCFMAVILCNDDEVDEVHRED